MVVESSLEVVSLGPLSETYTDEGVSFSATYMCTTCQIK